MAARLDNPFYYLDNFRMVLDWVGARYPDLLDPEEAAFITRFQAQPRAAQALLVRMVMRKGELFRASRLNYEEIGPAPEACAPLLANGWVDAAPRLTLEQLFALFTKPELNQLFSLKRPQSSLAKAALLTVLQETHAQTEQTLPDWCSNHPALAEPLFRLQISGLIERLRLMFFGNLHQDWTEFVLSDLGIYSFEKVAFSAAARGFQSRFDVEHYQQIFNLRACWQQGEAHETVLTRLAAVPHSAQSWLEQRRERLRFQIGQQYEREQNWEAALAQYRDNPAQEARIRWLRVLLRTGQLPAAQALALQIAAQPASEAEYQQLLRIVPRLLGKLKQQPDAIHAPLAALLAPEAGPSTLAPELTLSLPLPPEGNPYSVEQLAAQALTQADGPVFYVENTLFNSLFGLLCWDAIFAALPGAFFHPYQHGPVDLHSPDFYARRQALFDGCLQQLQGSDWQHTIRHNFQRKAGLQSPFVYWQIMTPQLLDMALTCIPAAHLALLFRRLLQDIGANRSGFPDLIQFWPALARYRMIEVKGPGDRLQDNQIRWLDYFGRHQIPVLVCWVNYAGQAEGSNGGREMSIDNGSADGPGAQYATGQNHGIDASEAAS